MSNTEHYKADFHQNYQRRNEADNKQGRSELALCKGLLRVIFSDYCGPVAIRLWDRHTVIGSDAANCVLIFRKQYPLRTLVLKRDMTALVDAYLNDDVDVEGDLEKLFTLVDYLNDLKPSCFDRIRILLSALRLPSARRSSIADKLKAYTRSNSFEAISHHYDVGNDFYNLFLDERMIYSCAYFSDEQQSSDDAQRDKLEHICRKLRLKPGMHLLDIGCGWGGMAIYAAQNYGVNVTGVTLSKEQHDLAREKVNALSLQDKVEIKLCDYRELRGQEEYDRVVSIGMFEHIGTRNYPVYFGLIHRLLKPGGVFLNHGITNDSGWDDSPERRFINNYIFPDGELARVSTVIHAMEEAGFEIADAESLRPHYVLTLRKWLLALTEKNEQARRIVGDATYRLWRLYMSGSAYYFDRGNTNVYQILVCKKYEPWPLPLRRDDIYSV